TCVSVGPLRPLLRGRALSSRLRDEDFGIVVTEEAVAPFLDEVRPDLGWIESDRAALIDGDARTGYCSYRALVDAADDAAPTVSVSGADPYHITYSPRTTGLPNAVDLPH